MTPEAEESVRGLSPGGPSPPGEVAPRDVLGFLLGWQGPPEEFAPAFVAMQCRLAGAAWGAILRPGPDGSVIVAGAYPADAQKTASQWPQLPAMAAEAVKAGHTLVQPVSSADDLYGTAPRRRLAVIPILSPDSSEQAVGAYFLHGPDPAATQRALDHLQWTAGLLGVCGLAQQARKSQQSLGRLSTALETLAAANEPKRFKAAAMALCNELAARWGCDRVGLGLLRGRYVRLAALSHTEKFNRKMAVLRELEAVMEECLDQDVEVLHPSGPEATCVAREAARFAARHGPENLLCLPLRSEGDVAGVLSLERPADRPFAAEDVETLRLAADLCTPRIVGLHQQDRWFGAKWAAGLRDAAGAVVGPRRTGLKLAVLAILAFLLYAVFAQGDYEAEASFALQSSRRQVIPAPFDGYIQSVADLPKDNAVEANAELATLDTSRLRGRLAAAQADLAGYLKQASAAAAAGRTAESQIAQAQADGAQAEIGLLKLEIGQARIASPIAGTVVVGDLKRMVGAPVKAGQVLFEVAPPNSTVAELLVGEDQIADVALRQHGYLATASYPDQRINFVVERIEPVAEVVNQRNVFRVRATLDNTYPWMRLGMEGVARIHLGTRSRAWLWTRPIANWVRMKLWI